MEQMGSLTGGTLNSDLQVACPWIRWMNWHRCQINVTFLSQVLQKEPEIFFLSLRSHQKFSIILHLCRSASVQWQSKCSSYIVKKNKNPQNTNWQHELCGSSFFCLFLSPLKFLIWDEIRSLSWICIYATRLNIKWDKCKNNSIRFQRNSTCWKCASHFIKPRLSIAFGNNNNNSKK